MEKIPETPQTVEFFEKVLNIDTTDVDLEKFKKSDFYEENNFVFIVTPEYKILLSDKSHRYLADKYGLDLDRSLTEGYLTKSDTNNGVYLLYGGIKINKNTYMRFKRDGYQPVPGFKGSPEEFFNLKTAIKNKISDLMK